jgi:hypothetical protein
VADALKAASPAEAPAPEMGRLAARAAELWAGLRDADPEELAGRTGTRYEPARRPDRSLGVFHLSLWGRPVELEFPSFAGRDPAAGRPLSDFERALLATYFTHAGGAPPAGRWLSFSELPGGRFYAQAFQGYTGDALARAFGNDGDAFSRAALALGGRLEPFADLAYRFQALPRVPLLAACWLGDEEFPASYRILFDASAGGYLPADGCAILGGTLARRLIGR